MAETAIVWHYTTAHHLVSIVTDGVIKPATAYVPKGEKPIVWFSSNQYWEKTASKAIQLADGTIIEGDMAATEEAGNGLVRIGVSRATAPHDWHALRDQSGMSGKMARSLHRAAIDHGARPGEWFGCFVPVPQSDWIAVEVYRAGEWIPFEDALAQLEPTAANERAD